MFDTVLIANRGEIAVRIMRTLRRMGIRSVAVFSDADAGSRHTVEADLAVHLGPTPAAESYLHIGRVLAVAREVRAQAIHPGYGFLAENANFAQACADAGIVFIGPSPKAIELMGDKIRAKQIVAAAGVPVVPGRTQRGMSDEDLVSAAEEVGYPVLIKPSAGGGGKGMHLVERPDELELTLVTARREAAASFGDDTLFLERYVDRPRHIEMQVLSDTHGHVLHLGERECSLQRRHQKIIEEAPSTLIHDRQRVALGEAAVATAHSVGYIGVGTVEFIVPADMPDTFYFMEMNTRLQVEHPVTELVTGIDLVEQQLRVAAGEELAFDQDQIKIRGHAVEARVYAEDPASGFLPTGGTLLAVQEPSGEGIRVDSCLLEGNRVGSSYDPLLAKVVAWAPQRPGALSKLRAALARTVILGLVTNLSFLQALLEHPDVVAGRLDTELVEKDMEALTNTDFPESAVAAYALCALLTRWPVGAVVNAWDVPDGWRAGRKHASITCNIRVGSNTTTVVVSGIPEEARLTVGGGGELQGSLYFIGKSMHLTLNGVARAVTIAEEAAAIWVHIDGGIWKIWEAKAARTVNGAGILDTEIRSPMPGVVIDIPAGGKHAVLAGSPIVVIEAMKMEHMLVAPMEGRVEVRVKVGDSVTVDQVVARLHPVEKPFGNVATSVRSEIEEAQ